MAIKNANHIIFLWVIYNFKEELSCFRINYHDIYLFSKWPPKFSITKLYLFFKFSKTFFKISGLHGFSFRSRRSMLCVIPNEILAALDSFLIDKAGFSSINNFKTFLAFRRFCDIFGFLRGVWTTAPVLSSLALLYSIARRDGALLTL